MRSPTNIVSAYVLAIDREAEGGLPYILFRHTFSTHRADIIRPAFYQNVWGKQHGRTMCAPTIRSGRCLRIGREAEGGLPYILFRHTFSTHRADIIRPYNLFRHMLSQRPGGRVLTKNEKISKTPLIFSEIRFIIDVHAMTERVRQPPICLQRGAHLLKAPVIWLPEVHSRAAGLNGISPCRARRRPALKARECRLS